MYPSVISTAPVYLSVLALPPEIKILDKTRTDLAIGLPRTGLSIFHITSTSVVWLDEILIIVSCFEEGEFYISVV